MPDIKTSLRFPTKRRVIPKAAEQPSPNTHKTRDPKSKSAMGESSRNAKIVNVLSVKTMITLLHSVPLGSS